MTDPDLILGDFRIERRLGAGGMGVVYLARQISLNRLVALKSLGSPLTDDAAVARFRRAAQAAAKLRHPGIAAVYHIGQDDTACYVAMEYIDGAPLDAVIRRLRTAQSQDSLTASMPVENRPTPTQRFDTDATGEYLPPVANTPLSEAGGSIRRRADHFRRAVEIVRDAARALDFAHAQGVIHRDIKPGNLMLDAAGRVVVIDFGLARFFEDESVTVTGQLVGTPMYMSPEQVTGRLTLDARTDVYSLGLVLYELLTLLPPITADNREQLLRKVVTKPLAPLRKGNPDVPADVEAVVHAATAKDPDDRYKTAGAFADDLDRYLAGKPVSAKPYRFVADESEITNTRPGAVLFAAVVHFFYAMLCVIAVGGEMLRAATGQTEVGPRSPNMTATVVQWAGLLLAAGALTWAGRRLLSAAKWSWPAGVLMQLVVIVVYVWVNVVTVLDVGLDVGLNYHLVPLLTLSCLSGACVWVLTRKNVRDWFASARRVRADGE